MSSPFRFVIFQRFVDETPHGVLLLGDVFGGIQRDELIFVHDLVVLR
jgi:hypothetical protein